MRIRRINNNGNHVKAGSIHSGKRTTINQKFWQSSPGQLLVPVQSITWLKGAVCAIIILFVLPACLLGAQVKLSWKPSAPTPDVYWIFCRQEGQSYNYRSASWAGQTTNCVIDNLEPGTTYHFVARAFLRGEEIISKSSNEVSCTIPQNNQNPLKPVLLQPIDGAQIIRYVNLIGSEFQDPDEEDTHQYTHWRITSGDDPQKVVYDKVVQKRLTHLRVPRLVLAPGHTYIGQVRYGDNNEAYSQWSDPVTFTMQAADPGDINNNGVADDNEIDAIVVDDPLWHEYEGQQIPNIPHSTTDVPQVQSLVVIDNNGAEVECAANIDPASIEESVPPGELPFGLVGYKIRLAEVGQEVVIRLYFSQPLPSFPVEWVKYDSVGGWRVIENAHILDDSMSVELKVRDGGEMDADGVANGVIIDPVGVLIREEEENAAAFNNDPQGSARTGSDNTGGSCFIQTCIP